MNFEKLENKRVLVTAGAQGIGEAISRHFIEAGAHLAIHYFSSDTVATSLVELAESRGLRAVAVQGDLCKREDAEKVAAKVEDALGGLDVLVNNAGSLMGRRELSDIEDAFWRSVWDVNLTSNFLITQAVLDLLVANENSSIVNLSSLAGRKGGHAGSVVYSAAKGGILTWSRSLATELGPKGVRVNAIAPGLILGTSFHNTHTTEESAAATIASLPLARAGTPDDVARAVLFLASEYDGFISGATLDINGGVYGC
ncbi:SDR family oxidoreductase [Pelagicoccus sp. SDUM812002]|uniref:SDR family NAD(P)-dependent oxidoreductase n=1 Tax=Pelagicoccus sp. SDUM812002 TaxID=3041266 RepID=UPI00280EAA88|nr:SDR family oxidoreductase [Pelagicoccus sp. SDUM812002]MDQ8186749.1 SDR family oxidoreductase [Pelagicoccus sp. SDUM812002]